MSYDKCEVLRAVQLLEQRLRAYESTPSPGKSDPVRFLWQRHLQLMREEASTLRRQLLEDRWRTAPQPVHQLRTRDEEPSSSFP